MKRFPRSIHACAALGALLMTACGGGGSDDGGGGNPPATERTAFVLTTDFTVSSFATTPVADPTAITVDAQTFGGDSVVHAFGTTAYVIGRSNAHNVTALDATNDYAVAWQCSVAASGDDTPNPQDIAVLGDKGYVSLLEDSRGVAIVNLNPSADCSDFIRGHIDLSSLADGDGIPEAYKMVIVGDRLYVSVQRLENFAPAGPGVIGVIDTSTDTLVGSIELSGENPFGETKGLPIDPDTGKILVSEVGSFGTLDGGIERVDPAEGVAEGFFITEQDLGGDINDFVIVSSTRGYAIISSADFSTTSLVRFDPSTAQLVSTVASGSAFLPDVEYDPVTDQLFLATQDFTAPGLRVFDGNDVELTSSPIDAGLPAFQVDFIE